jgi:hypothetical protein
MDTTEQEINNIQESINQEYAFRNELLNILDINELNEAKKIISKKLKTDKEFLVRYEYWLEYTGYDSWKEFYEEEMSNYDFISKEMSENSDEDEQ